MRIGTGELAYLFGGPLLIAIMAGALAALILFLVTVRTALLRCAPGARLLGPNQVWLALVPFFGSVWTFFLVAGTSKSIGAELRSRQIPAELEPGKAVGLAWPILALCGGVLAQSVVLLGWIALLASTVCWIVYWVTIARCSAQLAPGR